MYKFIRIGPKYNVSAFNAVPLPNIMCRYAILAALMIPFVIGTYPNKFDSVIDNKLYYRCFLSANDSFLVIHSMTLLTEKPRSEWHHCRATAAAFAQIDSSVHAHLWETIKVTMSYVNGDPVHPQNVI